MDRWWATRAGHQRVGPRAGPAAGDRDRTRGGRRVRAAVLVGRAAVLVGRAAVLVGRAAVRAAARAGRAAVLVGRVAVHARREVARAGQVRAGAAVSAARAPSVAQGLAVTNLALAAIALKAPHPVRASAVPQLAGGQEQPVVVMPDAPTVAAPLARAATRDRTARPVTAGRDERRVGGRPTTQGARTKVATRRAAGATCLVALVLLAGPEAPANLVTIRVPVTPAARALGGTSTPEGGAVQPGRARAPEADGRAVTGQIAGATELTD
jgi:hypothetical protein